MVDIRTPNFGKIKLFRHVDFSVPLLALALSGILLRQLGIRDCKDLPH